MVCLYSDSYLNIIHSHPNVTFAIPKVMGQSLRRAWLTSETILTDHYSSAWHMELSQHLQAKPEDTPEVTPAGQCLTTIPQKPIPIVSLSKTRQGRDP